MIQATKKKKKRFTNSKAVDMHYMGQEPILEEVNSRSDIEYGRTLTWYGYFHDTKDGRKWLESYVKTNYPKETYNKIRALRDSDIIPTACWICKMIQNGTRFSGDCLEYLENKIDEMYNKVVEVEESEKPEPIKIASPFKRTQQKAFQTVNAVEQEIDRFLENDFKTDFRLYDYLNAEGANPVLLNMLRAIIEIPYKEMTDPDNKEYFSGYSITEYKRLLGFYAEMLYDLNRFNQNKKVIRKPRKTKLPSVEKTLAKFNYCKSFDPLKLVSVDPTQIIGAKTLWVYVHKYRRFGVYHSKDDMGFKVSGSTLSNFDEEKSVFKSLRKPEETLKKFFEQGKVGLRGFMDNISAKDYPIGGRINTDTILLKAQK